MLAALLLPEPDDDPPEDEPLLDEELPDEELPDEPLLEEELPEAAGASFLPSEPPAAVSLFFAPSAALPEPLVEARESVL